MSADPTSTAGDARYSATGGDHHQFERAPDVVVRPEEHSAGEAGQSTANDEEGHLLGLLERMCRRDQEALANLYEATKASVYGVALRITARADAAEEVLADTYLQAWRDATRYAPSRGRVLTWLLTICRSRAIDSLRRRDQAQLLAEPEQLLCDEVEGLADPHEILATVERDSALHAALSELGALQRQVLALAFFRGLTHEEISSHTGLPLGTVKTHIRSAIAQLRARLAGAAQEAP
jgi:RNA polymerase sigma-70 factor (ECF subfamily)